MFWEQAHNDILQFPIELGLAGMILFGAAAVTLAVLLGRSYFWENPLSASVIFAALLILGYSWWDFPFQNPAILVTWCTLVVAAVMWARMEETKA